MRGGEQKGEAEEEHDVASPFQALFAFRRVDESVSKQRKESMCAKVAARK